ncbi:hypothetical protein [Aquimarina sp. MMG016]|uniref:carboxymuconolactone decarboxylase family protein n=1 Tax=Aquimarina sp. MMG016 TaxID=2822690 RepID=UPI001B39DE66|nr:hypothetical protein [Aquimarina sp. MMG016]MBQ4821639.1 hypothetical protein [Aquimarina sp. MMG016]
MLSLVNELIGVIPNADPILEIWPTGFRTYNILVPNLLGLPNSLWKGKLLKQLMGLAMYTASKEAGCQYCTAHCCSFALRRGLDSKVISGEREYTELEEAVVSLAKGMSTIPSQLTKENYSKLTSYLTGEEIDKIIFSIGLMGFLNKFMDAVGIELETGSIQDVGKLLLSIGWDPGKHSESNIDLSEINTKPIKKDNFLTYLRILRYAPWAVMMEKRWTKGVPDNYEQSKVYLEKYTGYTFPFLKNIKSKRVIKTLTFVLKSNLDPVTTELGLRVKYLSSLVYYLTIQNKALAKEAEVIILKLIPDIGIDTLEGIKRIGRQATPIDTSSCKKLLTNLFSNTCLTKEEAATIMLTKAISNSPAEINDSIIKEVIPSMKPDSVVELGVWISIQQLLHRLSVYFNVING